MTDSERDTDEERRGIPLRRDGSEKKFWYDPQFPGHIVCNEGSHLETICIGHHH